MTVRSGNEISYAAPVAAKLVAALPSTNKSDSKSDNRFDWLRRITRGLLVSAAVAAVVILALRSALGPFQLWSVHAKVNSPFAAENAFWLAILGLLLFGRRSGPTAFTHESAAGFPRIHLAFVLCVIALAFARNLADPFLSDDYIILSGPSFNWQSFVAALHRPGGDGSFRPLGTVYYQIVKTFAGMSPVKWHLVGLCLHLLNSAVVFGIAWRLWRDKTTAALASLVFGLHGTRPEAALWTAGNCDLLAGACVLGSIGVALSQRATGQRARLIVSLLLIVAGVLFKESAYATPLIALALILAQPNGRGPQQFRPFLIGSTAVCAALFAWRWHLFHGPGGYIDRATGQPAILSLHPLTGAKAVFLRIWAILLAPINWDAPLSWWLPLAVIASMLGLLLLTLANRSAAARRTQLCLIAATCFAVLPAIHLALIGQSELGSRVLYLAGAPFALLIGSLVPGAGKRRIAISVVMLAGMTGILQHNLSAWHKTAALARTLCHDAAAQPSGTADGVFLFQNGFPECVAAERNLK
jgi:hypothetical protein